MLETAGKLVLGFPYAVAAGLLVAVVCAVFGVFVILKRVVFIGIALSEIAACGMAAAMVAGLAPMAGAVALTLAAVVVLALQFENWRIPRDAFLGLLFVAASSLSVLLVARSGHGLHEIKSLLYGDLILASRADFLALCWLLLPALGCVLVFLRPLLYAFLDRDAAKVARGTPARWEMLFFVLLGVVVAAASKVAGALLVFCYLVAPASTALLLSRQMKTVLLLAAAVAGLITVVGLGISFAADWPTNQTICVIACIVPALAGAAASLRRP